MTQLLDWNGVPVDFFLKNDTKKIVDWLGDAIAGGYPTQPISIAIERRNTALPTFKS